MALDSIEMGTAGRVVSSITDDSAFFIAQLGTDDLEPDLGLAGGAVWNWLKAKADAVYQPVDSDLTAIAALSTASYGRSFLTLADAAAGRTLLGLGALATLSAVAFADLSSHPNTLGGYGISDAYTTSQIDTLLAAKAPLANPTFTGVATAPTLTPGTNSTRIATTAYVDAAIAALIGAAPGTLDTLAEIAAAIEADESTAAALATAVAGKLTASNNLSDLANVSTARTNLGLGTAAQQNTSAFLLTSNNLSDLGSATTARTNLGLGLLATVAPGTGVATALAANADSASGFVTQTGGDARFARLGVGNALNGAQSIAGGTLNGTVLDISQTWGGTGTYTGIKYNVTDSGPANAASLLMDLQVGGSSKLSVLKNGTISSAIGFRSAFDGTNYGISINYYSSGIQLASTYLLGWTASSSTAGANADTILTRAAPATFQHGAADAASPVAQTVGVQNVVAGTSNTAGANFTIRGSAGTGTGAGGAINLQIAPAGSTGTSQNTWVTAFQLSGAGHLLCPTDNTYDIGASGANRPRDIYLGRNFTAAGCVSGSFFRDASNNFHIYGVAGGSITLYNSAETDFNRLQFGGITSSFPALKRSSTTLQARLADDSAFAPLQGKLTTDNAYTATPPTCTGYVTMYDSTGTAYKVMVST